MFVHTDTQKALLKAFTDPTTLLPQEGALVAAFVARLHEIEGTRFAPRAPEPRKAGPTPNLFRPALVPEATDAASASAWSELCSHNAGLFSGRVNSRWLHRRLRVYLLPHRRNWSKTPKLK